MKVLVTGVAGQLGYECVKRLELLGIDCKGVDYQDFDLTDAEATMSYITEYAPDAIIHCAAYTNVDKAETEPQVCIGVNAMGTVNVCRGAVAVDAKLIYISTDYVFDGEGERPFEADDPHNPKGIYALSKDQGEEAVRSLLQRYFIVRTAWVFGSHGKNFVKTMLNIGHNQPEVNVVCDQWGSPTYTPDLAKLLCEMVQTDRYGDYHATNEGFCNWAEFAEEIMLRSGRHCRVNPIPSSEFPSLAKRPANSRLSKRSLDEAGFDRLPPWQSGLDRFLQEIGELVLD